MIRPCENWRALADKLSQFGAFGVKAACTLAAYGGPAAFVQAFETQGGAALLFEGELILCGDGEELLQFALLCPGVRTVLCEAALAGRLPLPPLRQGVVMAAQGGGVGFPAPPELDGLYGLITQVFGLSDMDKSLYVDLSHRLRHGASDALCRDGGCAVVHHGPAGSLLSAMAVEEHCRERGLGTALAAQALRDTTGPLWLFCADERARRLYTRAGFAQRGQYALLERKESHEQLF